MGQVRHGIATTAHAVKAARQGPRASLAQLSRELGIEHRRTKPNYPWTNGQVGRMSRTIKDSSCPVFPCVAA
jgi:transposase InsO family protein